MAVRALSLLALSAVLAGCGQREPTQPISFVPAEQPKGNVQDQPVVAPPAIGLTPLPSARDVQDAAPGGRGDPFAPLPGQPNLGMDPSAVVDPVSKVSLTGVISVGGQTRALVGYGQSSGEICIGPDGRCPDQTATLLPAGWSLLAIDVQRGCIQLAQNGKAQPPLCMA